MERTNFEKLRVYQLAETLANDIWEMVIRWKTLAKDTVGNQLIRSADSIGANLSEGERPRKQSRQSPVRSHCSGALYETKHWLRRAFRRRLMAETEIKKLSQLIDELTRTLNGYLCSLE